MTSSTPPAARAPGRSHTSARACHTAMRASSGACRWGLLCLAACQQQGCTRTQPTPTACALLQNVDRHSQRASSKGMCLARRSVAHGQLGMAQGRKLGFEQLFAQRSSEGGLLLSVVGCVLVFVCVYCQNSLEEQDMSPECKSEVMRDQNRMAQVGWCRVMSDVSAYSSVWRVVPCRCEWRQVACLVRCCCMRAERCWRCCMRAERCWCCFCRSAGLSVELAAQHSLHHGHQAPVRRPVRRQQWAAMWWRRAAVPAGASCALPAATCCVSRPASHADMCQLRAACCTTHLLCVLYRLADGQTD